MAEIYCVALSFNDGHTYYAGADSHDKTTYPEYVMPLEAAKAKANWWKRLSGEYGRSQISLSMIEIVPVSIKEHYASDKVILIKCHPRE